MPEPTWQRPGSVSVRLREVRKWSAPLAGALFDFSQSSAVCFYLQIPLICIVSFELATLAVGVA